MPRSRLYRAKGPYNRTSHRLRELERVIALKHRSLLPYGTKADVYLRQVAKLLRRNLENKGIFPCGTDVLDRVAVWAERWAPFTPRVHLKKMVDQAMRWPRLEKADELGLQLGLTYEERAYLKITTIGACDVSKAERSRLRKERKRERDKLRARDRRLARGAQTREEYIANSLTTQRPWAAEGISRRTWERRREGRCVVGPSPTIESNSAGRRTCDNG